MTNTDPPTPRAAPGASPAMDEAGLSADQALALDHALGILVEPLLGEVSRRIVQDEAFARLVAGYRVLFDPSDDDLADGDGHELPSPGLWDAIARRTVPGSEG